MTIRTIGSPLGDIIAAAAREGVCLLAFADAAAQAREAERFLSGGAAGPLLPRDDPMLDALERELGEYFCGKRRIFGVPVRTAGSDFQEAAWRFLAGIPYGRTASYGEQARAIGREGAARAVARADGANRVCILIPCHRVLGSDGSLTGYSGGIERKRRLLALEASGRLPT